MPNSQKSQTVTDWVLALPHIIESLKKEEFDVLDLPTFIKEVETNKLSLVQYFSGLGFEGCYNPSWKLKQL